MDYKLYVSGYIEETQQLLISFSSDETAREAIDYQSMAFDVVPYGDVTAQEVIDAISKVAPTVCSDVVVQETYKDDSAKAQALRDLVGQEFTYTIHTGDPSSPDVAVSNLSHIQSEEKAEII